jgi:hypothetical protein
MECGLCLTSNQFNFYTMRAFIIAIAMLAATMASAQTSIKNWQGQQNYRDVSHATVWAGEVQHGGKSMAVSVLRNEDMGYTFQAGGHTFVFPFTSKIDSRECPVLRDEAGKEIATITAFRIKGAELQLLLEYQGGDFVPTSWVLISRVLNLSNVK